MTGQIRPWGIRLSPRDRDATGATQQGLALALALRAAGQEVRFFAEPEGDAIAAIHRCGFALVEEAGRTAPTALGAAVGEGRLRGAVFASPAAAHDGLAEIAGRVPTAVIGAHDRSGAAGLMIDPSPGATVDPPAPGGRPVLAGLAYALLDPALGAVRDALRAEDAAPPTADRLLVAMGAPAGVHLALDALGRLEQRGVIVVLADRHMAEIEQISRQAERLGSAMVEVDWGDPTDYFRATDLVIGHGGWQLAGLLCCGVPSITLARDAADAGNVIAVAAAGATIDAGRIGDASPTALAETIAALIEDGDHRLRLRRAAVDLVDGRGAERVVEALLRLTDQGDG